MSDPYVQSVLAVGVSALLSAALVVSLRRKAGGWQLLLLGLLPGLLIYLTNPCVRIYLAHGFAHISTLYQILNGFVPPDNIIFGGEPQLYPWMHGLLAAGIVFVLRVPPTFAFAAINCLALAGSLVLAYHTGRRLRVDREAAALGATLAVFGVTFLNQGAVTLLLREITGPRLFEWRALASDKFTNVNAMPLGILFFALFVYAVVRLLEQESVDLRGLAWLFLSVLGSALFYPLVWTGLLASFCSVVAVVGVARRRTGVALLARMVLAVAAGSLLAVPYFLQLGGETGAPALSLVPGSPRDGASFLLAPDFGFVLLKLARWSLFLLPLAALLVWKRRPVATALRSRPLPWLALGALAATTSGLYLLVTVTPPLSNEYKYLVLACLPLGLAGGPALREILRGRPLLCSALLAAFLLPATGNWIEKFVWRDCNRQVVERMHLRHTDPQRDELYCWIGDETPRDALFVDSRLTIPVFGRRQLYIGLGEWFEEGWTTAPREILLASHYSPRQVYARETVANAFLTRPAAPLPPATLDELRRTSRDREVFVVFRETVRPVKLAGDPEFERVFANGHAVVYKLRNDDAD